MANKRVRVGTHYQFHAVGLDAWSPVHQGLQEGQEVVVVNLRGCPPANTMGMCYVNDLDGHFGGLVLTNSLLSKADYKALQSKEQ